MDKFNFETEACEVANPKDSMERLTEEARFEVVCKELDKGIKKPGLWLKAKTEAKGNIDMAEAIYAGLRVQSLKDEEDMLRAGSEAKIARIEKARLAEEAEAARVVEAARLAEEVRIEREIQRSSNTKVTAVCDSDKWQKGHLGDAWHSMYFLKDCGYEVHSNFIGYSLNGVKIKRFELMRFAVEVRKKREYISFRR
jgi:hypothetical protein